MRRIAGCLVLTLALLPTILSAQTAQSFRNKRPSTNGTAPDCGLVTTNLVCDAGIGRNKAGVCTLTVENHGGPCNGGLVAAVGVVSDGTVDNVMGDPSLSLQCFPTMNLALPLSEETGILQLSAAALCAGPANIPSNATLHFSGRITPSATATSPYTVVGAIIFADETGENDGVSELSIPLTSCTPTVSVPAITQSGSPYTLTWTATTDPTTYEVQEATHSDFSDANTTTTRELSQQFQHSVTTATTYYYRVRATTCSGSAGAYSAPVQIAVLPAQPATSSQFDIVVPVGSTATVSQHVTASGLTPGATFSATTDKPYLTVTPSTGIVGTDGTVTVTIQGSPKDLPVGANTGTLTITASTPAGKSGTVRSEGSTTATVPVSISLVTPVTPTAKTTPPADALIIPAVAHLDGSGVRYQSDVRVTNGGTATTTYQLTFTPSNSDGSQTGRQTSVTIDPAQTVALNDILLDFFGYGTNGDAAGGVLEIRPTNHGTTPAVTYASSRTYAATPTGTFGQYIPAVPVSQFLTSASRSLTLTQVAQSTAFRTNVGLVEGLGIATSGKLRVFDSSNTMVKEIPFSLRPFEHQQLNSLLATQGITLADARIEALVNSGGGGITTYASVVDNSTNDPLLVSPVDLSTVSASRYVLPGMADLNNPSANFHSDIRLYNGSGTPATATLTFYPQGNPAGAIQQSVSIPANQIKAYDNVLPTLFNVGSTGGSIVVTTAGSVPLVASGRTYSNAASGGTFGQFIPAITASEGVGMGEGSLQVLQLEQSKNFRSNVGINELTGNPVTVQLSLILPDSKVTPSTTFDMQGNEFRQFSGLIASLNTGNVYNARVVVKVIAGTGRITAYGSVIDNATQDPTYVPAQK